MSRVSDFEHHRLDATVYPDCVVEIHRISDIAQGLRKVAVTKIWRTERILGRGTFGEVLLQAQDKDPESKRAVKVIRTSGRMSSVECERELTALIEFTKPKVSNFVLCTFRGLTKGLAQYKDEALFVAFLGWFQNENAMYLAMEYVPLGDLETNLQELEKSRNSGGGVLPEDEAKDITLQVLEGVKIMHAEGFAHRDLKPQVGPLSPIWHLTTCFGALSLHERLDLAKIIVIRCTSRSNIYAFFRMFLLSKENPDGG